MKFRSVELIPGQTVTLNDGRKFTLTRVERAYPHCPPAEITMVCGRHRIPVTQLADDGPDVALSWRNTDAQLVRYTEKEWHALGRGQGC